MAFEAEAAPHPVDIHVGARIRTRRKALKITQERLAAQIGITFQQVQKYERGHNRVSASRLFDIAQALDTPVGFFFRGLDTAADDAVQAVLDFADQPDALEVAQMYPRLVEGGLQPQLMGVMRSLDEVASSRAGAPA